MFLILRNSLSAALSVGGAVREFLKVETFRLGASIAFFVGSLESNWL